MVNTTWTWYVLFGWTLNYLFSHYWSFIGFEVPEAINKFKTKKGRGGVVRALGSNKTPRTWDESVHLAKKQFEIATTAGCDLGLQWLKRLIDYDEKVQKDLSLSM